MKLFHGSYSSTAPVMQIGQFTQVNGSENLYDGIFASDSMDSASSHGCGFVYTYEINDEKIASSRDLDNRTEEVYAFLRAELNIDDVAEIADRIMWDNDSDCEDFADILSPRSNAFDGGAGDLSWELQRLRGRVAAHLGFDAVEMEDEHGTSYLIVNPAIKAA